MIRGERVVLRPFRPQDAQAIDKWIGNEEITRYLGFLMFPQSSAETAEFVESQLHHNRSRSNCVLAIAMADDPNLDYVGAIGLHKIDWRSRNAELGIVIGREDLLSQGIGSEAIRSILDYGFNFLGLHKVYLTVFEYNARAIRCYTKCGFIEEGRLREQRFYSGRFYDVLIMGMTEHEYRNL